MVGYDFCFGSGRTGTVDVLDTMAKDLGINVTVVAPVGQKTAQTTGQTTGVTALANAAFSSTKIRQALATGDVAAAAIALGRPHEIQARVVPGDDRGTSLGFATANLDDKDLTGAVVPAGGVYRRLGYDPAGARHRAVVNIGYKPTFRPSEAGVSGGDMCPTVEAHLLEFSGDLYGRPLRLAFATRLRDERKFDDANALVAQIRADIAKAKESLR